MRQSHSHLLAVIVRASFADIALETGHTRLKGNTISDLVCVNARTDPCDNSCGLVSKNHRCSQDKISDATVGPVVHIATADTCAAAV